MKPPSFANRLKDIRREAGMSARVLAELSGTTRSVIANIENGRKEITVNEIVTFANVLDVTVGDIDQRLAHPDTVARYTGYRKFLDDQIFRLRMMREQASFYAEEKS